MVLRDSAVTFLYREQFSISLWFVAFLSIYPYTVDLNMIEIWGIQFVFMYSKLKKKTACKNVNIYLY